MLKIDYNNENGLKVREYYYLENKIGLDTSEELLSEFDIVDFYNSTKRMIWEDETLMKVDSNHDFDTFWIDLSRNENELFGNMRKNTQYEIRRAEERDNFEFQMIVNDSEGKEQSIDEMLEYCVDNFRKKGHLWSLSRLRIKTLMEKGAFIITKALSIEDGHTIAIHGYVYDLKNNIIRLNISASDYRKTSDSVYRTMAGRANRWLHWNDMKEFKRQGILFYDVGGIDLEDDAPEENKKITYFKYGLCSEQNRIMKKFAAQSICMKNIREIYQRMESCYSNMKDKKCIIYGFGITGKTVYGWLRKHAIEIDGVIDNTLCKSEKDILNREYLQNINISEYFIIIASSAWRTIELECADIGFIKNKTMFSVKEK